MTRIVFRRAQEILEMIVPTWYLALFISFILKDLKIRPVKRPTNILVGTQTIKVKKGLTAKRAVPKALKPKHWKKLTIPKIKPKKRPQIGETQIAPKATGMIVRVMPGSPGVTGIRIKANAIVMAERIP